MLIRKKILLLKKKGRQYKTSLFKIYFLPSDKYKIGFLARSKIGKASQRNYTKRIIREFWRKEFKKGNFLFVLYQAITYSERNLLIEELKDIKERIKCEGF
ncbi:MAG: ribonuclease P protein component [Candidatus Omnitrophica bacterium]|nr:ribonuclease P protein component [Candidatus Omnitrophota bacterium]